MFTIAKLSVCLALVVDCVLKPSETAAYNLGGNHNAVSRRAIGDQAIRGLVAGTVFARTLSSSPDISQASNEMVDVYYGVGCFWHIQHEMVDAERKILNRGNRDITSQTGYAGGKSTDKEGRVCYHNIQGIADYGKLGHGEVVGIKLPPEKVAEFAAVYFSLFDPRTKGKVQVH